MRAEVQLFILPFSGAKAAQFNTFCSDLGAEIETFTIEYAGRGRRAKEPYYTEYSSFIEDIYKGIKDHRDDRIPYALLGYSIGGYFAYDLLAKYYLKEEPSHLFICACENIKEKELPISQLPEDEFWDRVIRLGGVDKRLIAKRKFLRLFSKTMRADFVIGEQHRYCEDDKKIECPTTILYSEFDTPLENVKKWQEVCKDEIYCKEFEGDHFFLLNNHAKAASFIRKQLGVGNN